MAGIGEAIAVVQVGFSLAQTLSTYIGDYKDSRDSIIGLAGQLETTILHVRELNTLVRSSEAAGSVSEDSRKVAENAVTNSKRLIEKLVKLLTKADLPDDPDAIINIKPEDIDVRTLTRLSWPRLKPKIDVVNLELQSMKTEILLARNCIQAQTGSTAAERAAGADSIVALTKSKILARRLLKEAKAEEKKAAEKRSAMSAQQPNHVPPAPPGRNTSARYTSVPYRSGTYDSISDDGRVTDLMAQELRDSILEDLQRKDAERKAKDIAEGVVRKMAIEDYQQTVKAKLDRLHKSRETTQRRMKELFGPNLDEDLVKEFLDEQQSGQMQDEDREMLLTIGAVSELPPMNMTRGATAESTGNDSVRKSRRRWFFKRHSSQSSASTNVSNNSAGIMSSGLHSSERTKFLHIVMSYDSVEGKYSYQTLDNPALRHRPCGSTCDFNDTLRAWQALPRSVKNAASGWVEANFSDRIWHLHAALPISKDVRTTRKFLQKAVLGAVAYQGMSSIMLVFSSSENHASSETDSTAVAGGSVSDSSHTYVPMPDGGTPRVELSQTDVERMREWLTAKGLSTAKIAQLESLVVKKKESAADAAATQPSIPTQDKSSRQDGSTGHGPIDVDMQVKPDQRGSGSHVRFVTGDVAPLTQRHSATAFAPKETNAYSSIPAVPQQYGGYPMMQPYSHSPYEPPPPPGAMFPSGNEGWNAPKRHSTRREDYSNYGVDFPRVAHQNYMQTNYELPYRDRLSTDYRPHSQNHNTRPIPRYYDNRNKVYDVHKRTTDRHAARGTPYVDVYNDLNQTQPSPTRNRFDRNSRYYREPPNETVRSSSKAMVDSPMPYSSEPRVALRSPSISSSTHSNSNSSFDSNSWAGLSDDAQERTVNTTLAAAGSRGSARDDKKSSGFLFGQDLRRPRRDTSPHPVRRAERPSLRYTQKHGLIPSGYSYDPSRAWLYHSDYEQDAGRTYNVEKWQYRPGVGLRPTSTFVDRGEPPIPRDLSPKPILDDASDAEDAVLDDTELMNKMLVKYTGGIAGKISAGPNLTGDKSRELDTEDISKANKEETDAPDLDDPWGFGAVGKTKKAKKGKKEPPPGSRSRGILVGKKEEEWIIRRPRSPSPPPPPRDHEREEIIIRRRERSPTPEPPREPTPPVEAGPEPPVEDEWDSFRILGKKKRKKEKKDPESEHDPAPAPTPSPPPSVDASEPESPIVEPAPPPSADNPTSTNSRSADTATPTSPIPGIQRHNTATVEDYESDTEPGAHHSRVNRVRTHRHRSVMSAAGAARNPTVIEPPPPEPRTTNGPTDHHTVEKID